MLTCAECGRQTLTATAWEQEGRKICAPCAHEIIKAAHAEAVQHDHGNNGEDEERCRACNGPGEPVPVLLERYHVGRVKAGLVTGEILAAAVMVLYLLLMIWVATHPEKSKPYTPGLIPPLYDARE